jgi:hypothetical protein
MEEIDYGFHHLPAAYILSSELPEDLVDYLNNYLDELLKSENKKSQAHSLVGQISHGEQLSLDFKSKELKDFNEMLEGLGKEYIKKFCEFNDVQIKGKRKVEMDELWSVHSFAGDYNPIHDHSTKTVMGISCTMWTKVPKQILDTPTALGGGGYTMYNASRHTDGNLIFRYGESDSMSIERLKPSQQINIVPSVGKLLLFPSWLQHMVYPFEGDGERRTIAGNMNVWTLGPDNQKFISGAH